MNRLLFLLALLVGLAPAMAQTGTLQGTVRDAESGETLVGVNLVLQGTTLGAATTAQGTYRIDRIPAGRYTLVATFIGYSPATAAVTVEAGQTATADVSLEVILFQGDEVVISGTLRPEKLTETPATIQVISAQDLRFIPTTNPGELLARQKGVDYFRAGIALTGFNVRGFNSNFNAKNLQIVDGRVSTLVATGLPFGPLDPTSAEDIERQELVLGPNGALFGPNAHNGLINTITKDPRRTPGTVVNVGGGNQYSFSAGVRHAQVLSPELAMKVNLGYSTAREFAYVDTVYANFDANATTGPGGFEAAFPEYKLDRTAEFVKGSAALYYSPARNVDLIFDYGGSSSTYLAPTNVGRNQIIDWRIHTLQARLVTPNYFAQVVGTFSNTEDTYAISTRTTSYQTNLFLQQLGGSTFEEADAFADSASLRSGALFVDASRRLNAEAQYRNTYDFGGFNLDVVMGAQYQADYANSNGTYLIDGNPFLADISAIVVDQVGGYGQVASTFGPLRGVVAVRVDNHEDYGTNVLPKVGLVFNTGMGSVRATYGRGLAAPSILNLYGKLLGSAILGNAEGFTLSNGETIDPLTVEKIQTAELGYTGALLPRRLFVDVNAYYSRSQDFISPLVPLHRTPNPLDPTTWVLVTRRGDQPVSAFGNNTGFVFTYANFGEFDTYGADLSLTGIVTRELSVRANYSYFGLTFDETNLAENDFNRDGVVNDFDHFVNAPTHKASLAVNYNGPKVFGTLFGRWTEAYDYFSGSMFASKTRTNADGTPVRYQGVPIVEDARGRSTWNYGPLAGKVVVDLGLGYKVTPKIQLSGAVSNVFGVQNRELTASPFVDRLMSLGVRVEL